MLTAALRNPENRSHHATLHCSYDRHLSPLVRPRVPNAKGKDVSSLTISQGWVCLRPVHYRNALHTDADIQCPTARSAPNATG
jgi:hypothetical protein